MTPAPAMPNVGADMEDGHYFERVYALVATVPHGRVVTYGQIARALGARRGARAVGYALRGLPLHTQVPWWRVVNGRGRISSRGAGPEAEIQREMLEAEGVLFHLDASIDLGRFGLLLDAGDARSNWR